MSDGKFLSITDNPPPKNVECDILTTPISKPDAYPSRQLLMTYWLVDGYEEFFDWHDEHGVRIRSNVDVTHWAPTLDLYEYKLK